MGVGRIQAIIQGEESCGSDFPNSKVKKAMVLKAL